MLSDLTVLIQPTPFGTLAGIKDDLVSNAMFKGEQWDWHVCEALDPYLDGVVIEAGANVGALTMRFAKRASRVICFEPHKSFFYCLTYNIQALKLENVEPHNWGLYSSPVTISPEPQPGWAPSSWGWRVHAEGEVEAKPLAPCVLEKVTAIKVDAQGADLHCLMGLSWVIDRDHPVVAFEYEPDLASQHGHTWEDYAQWFGSRNYEIKPVVNSVDFLAKWRG